MKVLFILSSLLILISCEYSGGVREEATLEELDRWRAIADSAYAKQQYPRALNHYLKITESVPHDAEVWFRLGNTYNRLGESEQALESYKEALIRDNTYSKAWYNRSMVQLRMAAETFQEAVMHLRSDDPVYQASMKASEELLELINRSNKMIAGGYATKAKEPVLSPDEVEVIILNKDEKTKELEQQ